MGTVLRALEVRKFTSRLKMVIIIKVRHKFKAFDFIKELGIQILCVVPQNQSMTNIRTDRWRDGWTFKGQSDPVLALFLAGGTIIFLKSFN